MSFACGFQISQNLESACPLRVLNRIGLTLLILGQLSLSGFAQINGVIRTVAGNGIVGFSGDGGPATSAQMNYPCCVAVDSAGNIYIADPYNNRIRMVTPAGVISTVAGNGPTGYGTGGYSGDGGPATSAGLYSPDDVALDSAGNLYISDFNNGRVRKVSAGGVISTVAQLSFPGALAVDPAGTLYVADSWVLSDLYPSRVYKVTPEGLTIVAGGDVGS